MEKHIQSGIQDMLIVGTIFSQHLPAFVNKGGKNYHGHLFNFDPQRYSNNNNNNSNKKKTICTLYIVQDHLLKEPLVKFFLISLRLYLPNYSRKKTCFLIKSIWIMYIPKLTLKRTPLFSPSKHVLIWKEGGIGL